LNNKKHNMKKLNKAEKLFMKDLLRIMKKHGVTTWANEVPTERGTAWTTDWAFSNAFGKDWDHIIKIRLQDIPEGKIM